MKLAHILSGKQFADKKLLQEIFDLADKLKSQDKGQGMEPVLKGKIIANLFFEPSTRTRLSFSSAALKLGAQILTMENGATSSSMTKGESIEDMARVVCGYADAIVMRHPEDLAAQRAAAVSSVPIVNGGDGANEHPTQALYDLYTIQNELGTIDGLKIAFLADFRYQRHIHSLVPILSQFKNLTLYLVAPEALRLPQIYRDQLTQAGIKFEELDSVDAVLPEIDVLSVARVFKERFTLEAEYERLKKSFFVDQSAVNKMKKKSIILHVMPRVYEIDPAVDDDPRAAYFRQAHNGLYVRAALLHKLFID
jgi:aspartate carbamoyltransferase catalytic subunit